MHIIKIASKKEPGVDIYAIYIMQLHISQCVWGWVGGGERGIERERVTIGLYPRLSCCIV